MSFELDLDSLTQLWQQKWPGIFYSRWYTQYKDRWVRFHNLPESKRYPENETEYQIVLKRQNTLLAELNPGKTIIVNSCNWTDTPDPAVNSWPRRSELEPDALFWQTIDEDPNEQNPDYKSYRQEYFSKKHWRVGVIDELLRAVANDEVAGVIIAPEDARWLFCPYDGGVDVYLATGAERDELKERHRDWLSSHPEGL